KRHAPSASSRASAPRARWTPRWPRCSSGCATRRPRPTATSSGCCRRRSTPTRAPSSRTCCARRTTACARGRRARPTARGTRSASPCSIRRRHARRTGHPRHEPASRSSTVTSADVILETEGLTKEFRGFVAVNNVSLRVRRGSIHALIGPNGAGKTTCFNLLTHFLTPTAELPYGRKRALEIATTLALDPEMMLLDEPTAGMTHEDVDRITALIRRVAADRTVLMVEHNLSVVETLSNTITVLARGEVLA